MIQLIVAVLLLAGASSFGAVIPPFYLDSVVAIGRQQQVVGQGEVWTTEGTGFFYGWLVQDDPDPSKRRYETYLVTNFHVIANKPLVFVRLNQKALSDPGKVFIIPSSQWARHTNANVDIAITRINWDVLIGQNIKATFIANDLHSADTTKLKEIEASEGEGVFVLGFPLNLAGLQRNYVIARPGAIARITSLLDSSNPTFLIDSHVFPGNSGGPVVLETNVNHIDGTKSITNALVIGMVQNFIPYTDVAVSTQTQKARISFEENSGLSDIIPMQLVNETIRQFRETTKPASSEQLKPSPTK